MNSNEDLIPGNERTHFTEKVNDCFIFVFYIFFFFIDTHAFPRGFNTAVSTVWRQ